ncbi:hypothetical protein D3C78_1286440 [compost metagenome]
MLSSSTNCKAFSICLDSELIAIAAVEAAPAGIIVREVETVTAGALPALLVIDILLASGLPGYSMPSGQLPVFSATNLAALRSGEVSFTVAPSLRT